MDSNRFGIKVKQQVCDNFDRSYRQYEVFEEKHGFFYDLTLRLASHIGLVSGSEVLDVGCGNGISALALHDRYGCRVLGVDLSENMVAAGSALCAGKDIQLVVGDGEQLSRVVGRRRFDYVLYNASIFIFPDVDGAIDQACRCLRPGGAIGFSYYPELVGDAGEDLLAAAFEQMGASAPRYRVVTDYDRVCDALRRYCEDIRHGQWQRPMDTGFLVDLFTIPAQSASLFPGIDLPERMQRVARLFACLGDTAAGGGTMRWRLASGRRGR